MEKAIAYIRVSSDRQLDGNSLVTQEKRVLEYVGRCGYELEKLFVGKGESAKTDQRPELQEMLAYAKERRGALQVLIFPKVDRFARYTEDYFALKRAFRTLGIRVESCDERFDDSPAGRFMESMLAATAQFDNDVRSERCRGGMREAVSQGRWVWGAPVGYRNCRYEGKATIEPDPVKGPLIAEAFRLLSSGRFRPVAVRRWLEDHGVKIGRAHLYRLFANRAYLGVIEAFGLTVKGATPFLGLVSETVFYRARRAFQEKVHPGMQLDNPDFPLRGTLRCEAGHLLTACWSRGRSKRYAYYRCMSCPGINIPRDKAEQAFLKELGEYWNRYRLRPALKRQLVETWELQHRNEACLVEGLSAEIAKLEGLQRAVMLKNAEGVLPDVLAREQLDELSDKLSQKRRERAAFDTATTDLDEVLAFGSRFLRGIVGLWKNGDMETKKHLQSFSCPNGATISWKPLRTAQKHSPTGSRSSSSARVSHVVDRSHSLPNPKPGNERESLKDILDFYQTLHREFGISKGAGDYFERLG